MFVRSQSAEIGPPLGTVLGNLGVSAVKFVKDFNEFTKDLPSYFLLKVHVYILEDRSYNFSVFLPTIGFFLSFIKTVKSLDNGKKQYLVSLKNVIQLALFKFPNVSLLKTLPVVLGSVNSCGLFIYF
jgi:ribosomal protein L11